MKTLVFALMFAVPLSAADHSSTDLRSAYSKLTEEEIADLRDDITLSEVRDRLGYVSLPEIPAPMLGFWLAENEAEQFVLWFDEKTDRVLWIAKSKIGEHDILGYVYVWPKSKRGKKVFEEEANQTPDPTRLAPAETGKPSSI